jgi:hypothetical protein
LRSQQRILLLQINEVFIDSVKVWNKIQAQAVQEKKNNNLEMNHVAFESGTTGKGVLT